MVIGDRLKELRELKDMSQGDIEKRTGLLRCYVSRVENGHTVPSVETLEKMARALEVPMYKLFYDGETKAVAPKLHGKQPSEWGTLERDANTLRQFRTYLGKVSEKDRQLLMAVAGKLARRPKRNARRLGLSAEAIKVPTKRTGSYTNPSGIGSPTRSEAST